MVPTTWISTLSQCSPYLECAPRAKGVKYSPNEPTKTKLEHRSTR